MPRPILRLILQQFDQESRVKDGVLIEYTSDVGYRNKNIITMYNNGKRSQLYFENGDKKNNSSQSSGTRELKTPWDSRFKRKNETSIFEQFGVLCQRQQVVWRRSTYCEQLWRRIAKNITYNHKNYM